MREEDRAMAQKVGSRKKRQEEEKLKVQQMVQRFRKAQQGMAEKHSLWAVLDKFDRGKQWDASSIPPWVPKPVTNYIRYIRTLKRANLASSIGQATFTAEFSSDKELITKLQHSHDHVWEKGRLGRVVRRCVDRAILQGTSIAYIYTDDTYIGGKYYPDGHELRGQSQLFQGEICVKRFPNARFYPDPDATCIDECKYIETTDNVPLSEVKSNERFLEYAGDKLKNLKSGKVDTDSASGEIYKRDNYVSDQSMSVAGDEMVTLHTHWERYKDGKGVWHLNVLYYLPDTDFVLLKIEDVQPNEYPFAVLYDEEEEEDFWGSSTCMDLLENQKVINKVDQVGAIIGTLHSNPQRVVLRESGINVREMARTNTLPGKVWQSNIQNAVEIIKPPDIPRGIFEIKDRTANDIREIAGVNEAYTGQSVGSLTTSTGVNSLIERATIRDKDKMSQIDAFVERIAHLIVLNILHKWTERREVMRTQSNGQPEFMQYEPVDQLTRENLEWRVRSDVYAKAPQTQAAKRQQADKLMQMQGQFQYNPPIITPEEWIVLQDFDNKEQILKRMEEDRQRMMAQQSQSLAEQAMQLATITQALQAKGFPPDQVQQMVMAYAQQMLAPQQQQGQANAPSTPQLPAGAGVDAMQNMMAGM